MKLKVSDSQNYFKSKKAFLQNHRNSRIKIIDSFEKEKSKLDHSTEKNKYVKDLEFISETFKYISQIEVSEDQIHSEVIRSLKHLSKLAPVLDSLFEIRKKDTTSSFTHKIIQFIKDKQAEEAKPEEGAVCDKCGCSCTKRKPSPKKDPGYFKRMGKNFFQSVAEINLANSKFRNCQGCGNNFWDFSNSNACELCRNNLFSNKSESNEVIIKIQNAGKIPYKLADMDSVKSPQRSPLKSSRELPQVASSINLDVTIAGKNLRLRNQQSYFLKILNEEKLQTSVSGTPKDLQKSPQSYRSLTPTPNYMKSTASNESRFKAETPEPNPTRPDAERLLALATKYIQKGGNANDQTLMILEKQIKEGTKEPEELLSEYSRELRHTLQNITDYNPEFCKAVENCFKGVILVVEHLMQQNRNLEDNQKDLLNKIFEKESEITLLNKKVAELEDENLETIRKYEAKMIPIENTLKKYRYYFRLYEMEYQKQETQRPEPEPPAEKPKRSSIKKDIKDLKTLVASVLLKHR